MSSNIPHHIIALGASAGGMEELNSFFDHTPLDGVAYIVIQHLSADFKSRMVEPLSRHSKLIVEEAEEGTKVESNHVYLIPNDKFMTIKAGHLYFTDKPPGRGPHLTINTFFNSLAKDSGDKAIGIILSGLGSDGSEGIASIKKARGMVIARNPETTVFSGMPGSAVETGLVDFVLEPKDMPLAIEGYVKSNSLKFAENQKVDEKILLLIVEYLRDKSPFDFSDYKQSTILRRTRRRAENNGFSSLEPYLKYLRENPQEVEALSQEYLISVTAFFRDTEAYECIEKKVIPDLISNLAVGDELKLWVAGCATGEEAYSMAILIDEQMENRQEEIVVKIFATDIDTAALEFAGKGVYSEESIRNISAERLNNYFVKDDNRYRVKSKIRRMVIFAQHDLVKNPPYCNVHLISCRNLLIYMTSALQQKIYSLLLFGLRKDGYLFLGSSENPMTVMESLETVHKKWRIFKNLEAKRIIRFDTFSLPALTDKKGSRKFQLPENNTAEILAETVNTTYVNELGCLLVCIDENNHVVKTYGDTSKYLLQKILNSNLSELLPRPLAVAFNTLSAKAIKNNQHTSVKGIRTQYDDSVMSVNMSVGPITLKKASQKLYLVALSEDKEPHKSVEKDRVFDEKIYLDQYTLNLEEELNELKDKMHSVHLQLDASNENMQSFNEELLSANEEMQSSNEEMQSVNEELHTINSDYQLKNKELLELNDDLNNYFRSNINGQLFVNRDLLLMRFSAGTVKQINLLPSDIGRPLSNISTNIKFETFTEDIKKVIETGNIITKQIESNDGQWYQIMTMPYLQADDSINGAVITFNDISELKRVQSELDIKNEKLTRINADLDNFVHTASHDLLGPLGNIEGSIAVMNKIPVTDPELLKFLHIINSSVKKFRALIKDLSVIGSLEEGMKTSEMIDMDEQIDNIEWSLENKIKESGATIIRKLEVKHINFSRKNLRSIVYNLISNAIKFSKDIPPIVTVSTGIRDGSIFISVLDNGRGIEKQQLSTIFNMYGRLHQDIEGQGIGLGLAKKIIDAANGRIEVKSAVGKGTLFTIYLSEGLNS